MPLIPGKGRRKSEDHKNMGQDYGAAQPIVDAVRKPVDAVRRFLGEPDEPSRIGEKTDPSWHDDMVKKANASFANQDGGAKKPMDAKTAVSKMHPAHVHQLIQEAQAGKHGPAAQKLAQQATQAEPDGDEGQKAAPARNVSSIFSGGSQQTAPKPAPSRGAMFDGTRR